MRVAAFLLLLMATISFARPDEKPKLSPDLIRLVETARPGQTGEIIVQFEDGPGPSELRKVQALGGKQLRAFPTIRSAVFSIPLVNVRKLADDSSVVRIAPNRNVSAQKRPGDTSVLINGDKD